MTRWTFASADVSVVEHWTECLCRTPGVEVVSWQDARDRVFDAELMSSAHAHDRYGSFPRFLESQVLLNVLEDGSPELIVTTPPMPLREGVASGADAVVFRDARPSEALPVCRTAVEKFNEENPLIVIETVLVFLDLLGWDRMSPGD